MLEQVISNKAGWTRVAFGDVVHLSKLRAKDPEAEGYERVVGLEHIEPGDLRIRRWADIADGTTFTSVFKPGQVLFGKRRAYQRKVAVADFEGVCSGDIYVLEPSSDALMPELLPFICQTDAFFDHAVGTSAGSLSPRTNWKSLADFEFLLPPIQEQARLVEVFSATLDHLENLKEALIALDRLRLSLIFDFEATVEAKLELSSAVKRIEVGKSPKSNGETALDGETAVLKVSAVGDWIYCASENKVVKPDDFVPAAEVRAGDFLATRANADPDSVARTCIVESTPTGLMLSDKTWRVVPSDDALPLAVGLLAWTKSRSFRKHIRNQLNGTDAKNISQRAFLAGPLPKLDTKFAELDRQIRQINNDRKQLLKRIFDAASLHETIVKEAIAQ